MGVPADKPTLFIRGALVCAALLPWFAVFSGTYGLYFFIVLAVSFLAPWFFIPLLTLALPLAVLLLLVMPVGVIYAALRGPPGGWAGRLTRAGCLASVGFALVYAGLMAVMTAAWFLWEEDGGIWEPFLLWRAAVLLFGLWATWRAWGWLRQIES